ncbi:unnamed protein product [Rhizoctonia solani]|uniref:Transmembrane protein n=1 Tax=Rhizoctonia solani TaxID=456999 RepID=A0A8H3DU01_9AGAM|nr:unnamed protein product [Rhizoctonia solani]
MHRPTQQYSRVDNPSSDLMQRRANTPSPSLSKDPSLDSAPTKKKLATVIIMVLPLVLQAAMSLVIACIVIFPLHQSQYMIERHPTVPLADGTSVELDGYHLLQSDITTLLSVSLVILRWVAAAWTGPLCWRVVCLLGGFHGIQRQDIRWVSSRKVLPPSTHVRHPLAFVLGIILLVSVVPQAFSPLLTGAIMWEPITLNLNEIPGHPRPTVSVTGTMPGGNLRISPYSLTSLPMRFARDYITSWGINNETYVSKRVVSSIAGLGINSTLANVTLPYLHTSVEWYKAIPSQMEKRLNETLIGNGTISREVAYLSSTAGFIWLTTVEKDPQENNSWYLILRIRESSSCPSDLEWVPGACFAMGHVSFNATSGYCLNCRVTFRSVIQNDTDLHLIQPGSMYSDNFVARQLPTYVTDLIPLAVSLPSPEANPTLYVQLFLSRAYSALWSSVIDTSNSSTIPSDYSPPLPALRAQVDIARVSAWLVIQLAATCAGLVFLYLQSKSKHPLIEDTSMIAFDMDSSDAPRPSAHDKSEPTSLFRIQPDGDVWKVVPNV